MDFLRSLHRGSLSKSKGINRNQWPECIGIRYGPIMDPLLPFSTFLSRLTCSSHLDIICLNLRMIQGMKKRGRKDWTVYILRCGDGSLYTGIAKDVRARVKQHNEGRGASYTRARLPVMLLYQQEGLTHSKALIREAQIKAMPRSKKEKIILNERFA
jgi:putative endonuclease